MAYRYEDVDKLQPCAKCAALRFWFDGEEWRCWVCVPPSSENVVKVELHDTNNYVNRSNGD